MANQEFTVAQNIRSAPSSRAVTSKSSMHQLKAPNYTTEMNRFWTRSVRMLIRDNIWEKGGEGD